MAQLVAHLLCKQGVRGSSPLSSTKGLPAKPRSVLNRNRINSDRGTQYASAQMTKFATENGIMKRPSPAGPLNAKVG